MQRRNKELTAKAMQLKQRVESMLYQANVKEGMLESQTHVYHIINIALIK